MLSNREGRRERAKEGAAGDTRDHRVSESKDWQGERREVVCSPRFMARDSEIGSTAGFRDTSHRTDPIDHCSSEFYVIDDHNELLLVRDWSNLPTDVLVLIFSRLDVRDRCRAASVCQGWRCASLDPACWRQADLMSIVDSEHAEEVARGIILRSRGQVRCLSLPEFSDSTLECIGKHCPLLEKVKLCSLWRRWRLGSCDASIESFQLFVEGCPQLRSLDLGLGEYELLDFVKILVSGFPNLVSLHLYAFEIDSDVVRLIVEHLPRLQTLAFQGADLMDEDLSLIAHGLRSLRYLYLGHDDNLPHRAIEKMRSARPDITISTGGFIPDSYQPITMMGGESIVHTMDLSTHYQCTN
ncbi:hypothetical protein CBR_g48229 [Chara braunii]|uniref:F-box domain-containing protein n=1 Tax=Chara braunii TaxID=69332 RepID=A0A388M2A0_CHABU|nr:hypothetical protein CBR_g48229 [Chara braunii]|eukprot:GBG88700.1 hypothetical protein CBR_g48229 [Chara braunii]